MNPNDHIDAIRERNLNALVDGELSHEERERLLREIETDEYSNDELCRLRRTKELVNHAFRDAEPPQPTRKPAPRRDLHRFGLALAASLLLCLGFGAGWFASSGFAPANDPQLTRLATQPTKVILHISSNEPMKQVQALDRAESLLREYAGRDAEIELVANSSGIDLLRADTTPYGQRIRSLMDHYQHLHLVACQNTLQKLQAAGLRVVLLDDTEVAGSAVEHIVMRLQQGWTYVKI